MTQEQIQNIVTSYLDQSQENMEIENPKCDFKLKWYDLTSNKGMNEFIKDTSAIANTFGPDGFIIIGFDPKTKEFHSSKLNDCNLKDSSQIIDIINKKVDRLFEIAVYDFKIADNFLSVIHIPPSIDKPHVIRNYQTFDKSNKLNKEEQHRIFVRKNTSTHIATRNDIELMYYDRKNIIPEYSIITSFNSASISYRIGNTSDANQEKKTTFIGVSMALTLENTGRRSIAITDIEFGLSIIENPRPSDILNLKITPGTNHTSLVIPPNEIVSKFLDFQSLDFEGRPLVDTHSKIENLRQLRTFLKSTTATFTLANNRTLKGEVILTH